MTEDIFVHVIDFNNTAIAETVTHNDDGSYSIFINSRLSKAKQTDAYMHALKHILHLDFESGSSVDRLEAYAHGLFF